MKLLSNRYLTLAGRLILAYYFMAYGWSKLFAMDEFARSILNYHMVNYRHINLMAMLLPWLEVMVGLGLLLGLFTRATALVSAGLMAVFTYALFSAWQRGLDINCGCSTNGAHPVGPLVVMRDVLLLLLSLQLLFLSRPWLALDRCFEPLLGRIPKP